jgi:hypothetical protein
MTWEQGNGDGQGRKKPVPMRAQRRMRHRARIIDRLGMRAESECAQPYPETTEDLESLLLLSMHND